MEEYLQSALEIVKAQAGSRPMTEEEILSMVKSVANGIAALTSGQILPGKEEPASPAMDPKKAIKEASITCLECGKSFKVITRKHLASHGLTPEEYRAKYGFKKTQALACKSLARERRAKMKDMKLWERRQKPTGNE
ncbi:MucR family transcriptional regulator [Desulfovibrio sp. TomC]|uniref:MucR family transcriptional regulator n=1 Tax=Desulfovibrio sp. TomC TaxID=1562888 RepID=UPI0005746308|nr:MucR family transcriptional regulator [Desulfovibrio sp. TomC]KHK00609.1 putative transcriptional regulator [Desulfovibrio sp. TomC]